MHTIIDTLFYFRFNLDPEAETLEGVMNTLTKETTSEKMVRHMYV